MDLSTEALISLFQKASDAKQNSYSPYSKFRVGAALLAKDGRVFLGTNVENASYGTFNYLLSGGTICAERSAVVSAVSSGCTEFEAIMVATDADDLIAPCGFCRQFMVEFGTDLVVILSKSENSFKKIKLSELLPDSFGRKDLDKPRH